MKRAGDSAHGVSERESQVLDRYDAGMSVADIAADLGVAANYVRWIIKTYPVSTVSYDQWVAAARASNAAFLGAIAATGRTFA